jgi:hypothetical protein
MKTWITVAMDMQITTDKLMMWVFSIWFPRNYERRGFARLRLRDKSSRVEAVSNTSTVVLRVVGGDKEGSLKTQTVKYGPESYRGRARE